MPKGINLLPRVEAIWEQKKRLKRWAQAGGVAALIVYFILLSSLLSYFLLLNKEKNTLAKKIAAYEAEVKNYQSVESKQILLKAKLKELTAILQDGENPEAVLKDLETLVQPEMELKEIFYQEGGLKIEAEAENVLALDRFVKNLASKGADYFSQANFENINRQGEGVYRFNLSLLK